MPKSKPPASAPASRRTKRSTGSVTILDVANMAGVAPMTASRAINTPHLVSPDALSRVRAAVLETGYVPNLLAGGLRSRKSRMVAAVVPTIMGPVFLDTIDALTTELAEAGYQLMLGQSGYANSREDVLLDAIIGRRPDGIVLTGVVHSEPRRKRLRASGIPVVETWDLSDDPIDMLIGFSHERVGEEVCRYLHQRGHRRIAAITGDDERALKRFNGLCKAARELGMINAGEQVPSWRSPAPSSLAAGRAGLTSLLTEYPSVQAVFCGSDMLAVGALMEAAERGIKVPEQLAVIGFADLPLAASTYPALTTVHIDGPGIGRRAARFIIDRANGVPVPERIVDVGFSIVQRASA